MIPMATLPFEPPAISSAAIGHSFYASDSKGNAPEFFLRGNNVTINFDELNVLTVAKDATVELIVKTNNDTKIVMDDKKSVTVQACNRQTPMKWTFIPTMGGQYTAQVNVTGGYNFGNRYVFYSEPVVNTGFRVLENNGGPVIEKVPIVSPLKQFKSGIAAKDVTCRYGLQLIFKFEDSSPVCVTKQTAQTLVERWWGMYVPSVTEHIPILSRSIKVQDTNFTINYDITGDNKILGANMDTNSKSLVLSLKTTSNGTLTVTMPRALIDSKIYKQQDGRFYALGDGQEIDCSEIKTTDVARTLSIPFTQGIEKIEIIGTTPI